MIFLDFSDAAYRFFGNHTHADYFKLLKKDGQSLLIGARNVIYNISLPYLTENVEQVRIFLTHLSSRLLLMLAPCFVDM